MLQEHLLRPFVANLRLETFECIAPCDLGCPLQDGMTKLWKLPPHPKPISRMSDVIKSWCKVTHPVALATIAIVDGTRAGLPAQGCNCCTGGVLSCQQGKRGACAGWEF